MKKKLLCGLLCLGLCLGSVQAAESGFADVKDSDWFAPYVTICAENGLMNGTGGGNFSPNSLLTEAECSTLALRLFMLPRGGDGTFETAPEDWPGPGQWWRDAAYTAQLWEADGLTFSSQSADRNFFVQALAGAVEGRLEVINSITALPDTADTNVLAFYNAGILTGVDDYGTFAGDRTLTRAEAAAMVARVLNPELRLSFVPKQQSSASSSGSSGTGASAQVSDEALAEAVMTVDGQPVSLAALGYWINIMAYQTDLALATYYNSRLDLTNSAMVQNIVEQAKVQAAAQALMENKAAQLGCKVDNLAAALAPSPSRAELDDFVQINDLLCAKHILVEDLQTAQAVLDGLKAIPTLDQFNALLYVFGSDPGMTSNPDGYLFGAGEMVQEFEDGTRALEIGAYSTEPVQSTYGYHIIWRLDPVEHPDLLGEYQGAVLEQQVNAWLEEADIRVDSDMLARIDVAGTYSAYLLQRASGQS